MSHVRPLIDDHFAGRIRPQGEHVLREHLPGCDSCRRYYERHLVLADLDPTVPRREERLSRGLGLSAPRRRLSLVLAPALGVVAAAAALLLLVHRPGFEPRGSAPAGLGPELLAYRIAAGRPVRLTGGALRPTDELAFAYRNPTGRKYLMVFGLDEHGHVYWYHPAWTDPARDPSSVPIAAGPDTRELPEAVAHALDGERLEVRAVFTDHPLTVRQVEALVRAGQPIPGAQVQGLAFQVVR